MKVIGQHYSLINMFSAWLPKSKSIEFFFLNIIQKNEVNIILR